MTMKRRLLEGTALLIATFALNEANAQTCTVPPTCESLGYDKSAADCVNKAILKCPFDKTKIFCSNGSGDMTSPSSPTIPIYNVGDTYVKNGITCGTVLKEYTIVDTDGTPQYQHLELISEAYTGTQDQIKAACQNRKICGGQWSVANANQASAVVTSCGYYYTGLTCYICPHSSQCNMDTYKENSSIGFCSSVLLTD